jgi:hypothetical protein
MDPHSTKTHFTDDKGWGWGMGQFEFGRKNGHIFVDISVHWPEISGIQ